MTIRLLSSNICAFWVLATAVVSQNAFSDPPPAGPDSNYNNNPVYALGSILNIQYCQSLAKKYEIDLFQQETSNAETVFGRKSYARNEISVRKS